MTDRPILFSGPMVRALLQGNKTQTRRIAKFIKREGDGWHIHCRSGGMWGGDLEDVVKNGPDYGPYAIGDRLWVKETWQISGAGWGKPPTKGIGKLHYRSTDDGDWKSYWGGWRSPLHMFRWASRLTLTVTDVCVERLQDISEADALAEGIIPTMEGFALTKNGECWGPTAKDSYRVLWDSINGEDAWVSNPWVVAVSFTVENRNIDQ